MPLDPSIAAKIAGYQQELRSEREDNRKRFPVGAELKDAFDRKFGKCKLICAHNAQTGERIGKVDAEPWLPWPDFGKYGGASAPVLRDSPVNDRIRAKARKRA